MSRNSIPATTDWPSVAILIPNWNGRSLLQANLPALLALAYLDYTVILIDNDSTDDSVAYVTEQHPTVQIIRHAENLGFAPGLNPAIAQCEQEIIVLLNNDVAVSPNWLTELVRPLRDNPEVGITGSKLLYPDEQTLQHAGAALTYPLAYSEHYFYRQPDTGQADTPREVDYVTGAAMAIARRVITAVGLLDELFAPFYYEEVDYCYRTRAAGFKVCYVPQSVAIHHESYTLRQVSDWHTRNFYTNRLRFVLKHYSKAQIMDDFIPAELERLQTVTADGERRLLSQIFLQIALELPETGHQTADQPAIQLALLRCRESVTRVLSHAERADQPPPLHDQVAASRHLQEQPFQSDTPLIGPAIATFRDSWNNVATKWYVRPLIAQQAHFNELVAQLLAEHATQNQAQQAEIGQLATELVRLRARLDQLEAQQKITAGDE